MSSESTPLARALAVAWTRLKEHPLAHVGPGLITGAADDDPSGIATASQAGAQFGLNMLWTMPLLFPLMSAMQSMCARIGRVTGMGLAANIKAAFPAGVLYFSVGSLLFANVLTIAADVAAMGEVAELVTGIDRHAMTALAAIGMLGMQVCIPYHRYVFFLKWMTLSLLAYGVVLFTVHVPWGEVALRTVWPRFTPNAAAATVAVGMFGATISPYLFFWQASEEVEDMHGSAGLRGTVTAIPLVRDPNDAPAELRRIRWDTWGGMLYSNATTYCIMLAAALTLNVAGVTDLNTAAQAASALRPLAGNFAFLLFALGILGVGLIGVPVLAGSGAYALSEAMGWKFGLERKAREARGFYAVIAVSVLAALILQYSPIQPMKALFWSAVINGVVAVPLMMIIMVLASRKSVMGPYTAAKPIVVLGCIATIIMIGATVRMFIPD